MFRVKVCGVTNVEDAITAVEAGADAIGLNFYEKSPRYVSPEIASGISCATMLPFGNHGWAPPDCIGVFVNQTPHEIARITHGAKLTAVQMHGSETPDVVVRVLVECRPRPKGRWMVVRARSLDDRGLDAIAQDIQACDSGNHRIDAVLIDSHSPGKFGGTGTMVRWETLADYKRWLGDIPLILAGGLTPDNVAEAIRIVRPAAVDVASGVESAPGKKDPVKVRDFVATALGAFETLRAT